MTEEYPTETHLKEWNNYQAKLLDLILQNTPEKQYYEQRLKSVKRLLELKK